MIKVAIILFALIPIGIRSETIPGFTVCGKYLLKGVLERATSNNKIVKKGLIPIIYKVNSGTNSEMQFVIKERADTVLISSYLNVSTEITAQISQVMDGTSGEIDSISRVVIRKDNPLEPLKNSGILLISKKNCLY